MFTRLATHHKASLTCRQAGTVRSFLVASPSARAGTLDPEMINEVLEVMVELAASGMTMICVTHEMGFARRVADKMVFMDHGEIVEMAEPERFFRHPESDRCRDFLQKILHH